MATEETLDACCRAVHALLTENNLSRDEGLAITTNIVANIFINVPCAPRLEIVERLNKQIMPQTIARAMEVGGQMDAAGIPTVQQTRQTH